MVSNCMKCGKEGTMVEIRGVYDGGLFYACMRDHRGEGWWAWHRWPTSTIGETRLRRLAAPYVRGYRGYRESVQTQSFEA